MDKRSPYSNLWGPTNKRGKANALCGLIILFVCVCMCACFGSPTLFVHHDDYVAVQNQYGLALAPGAREIRF